MDNEERDNVMRAGRDALFVTLVISGIIVLTLCGVASILLDFQNTFNGAIVAIILNACIVYPLYRHFVDKYLGL